MITVHFACNDERGRFTGKFDAVDFRDGDGHVVSLEGPKTSLSIEADRIRVSRWSYARGGWQKYVGNIIWDAVNLSVPGARLLLTRLLDRGFQWDEFTEGGPLSDLVKRAEASNG